MKQNYTQIVFIIDRSGSMHLIANDMMGGFKKFIEDQKQISGVDCDVSLYQFDSVFNAVYERKNIQYVPEYTLKPRGSTALYDAIGTTIELVGGQLRNLKEEERPDKVLFVIITDGEENSSSKFTLDKIKSMITHQTEKYNWTFSYIGANQDAWKVGSSFGINTNSTLTYTSTTRGVNYMWDSLSSNVASYRTNNTEFAFSKDDVQKQSEVETVTK